MLQTRPTTLIKEHILVDTTMDLGALQEQANAEIQRFESQVGEKEYDEILFLYLSKISEDIGNLSSAVMSSQGIRGDANEISHHSFADALYSIVVLAKKMNINLQAAMEEKIVRLAQEASLSE